MLRCRKVLRAVDPCVSPPAHHHQCAVNLTLFAHEGKVHD